MGGIGPMFGQVGFFHKFAGRILPTAPLERYGAESKRLLGVVETRLAGRQWIMDDEYTIADISMAGWVAQPDRLYEARDLVAFDTLKQVPHGWNAGSSRPAVQRGSRYRAALGGVLEQFVNKRIVGRSPPKPHSSSVVTPLGPWSAINDHTAVCAKAPPVAAGRPCPLRTGGRTAGSPPAGRWP